MNRSINTRDMSSVHDHDTAARLWTGAKPWKNKPHSWRELGGRRAFHKRIVKLNDDRGYAMTLFETPMVTYLANGDLELQVYDSASSHQFVWYVRPDFLSVTSHGGRMFWCVPTDQGKMWVRPERGPLKLRFISTGIYEITSQVEKYTKWETDLKKAAAVRKKLSHYDKWQKFTARLKDARWYPRRVAREDLRQLLAEPENIAFFPELGAPVQAFLREAYELDGARYQVPTPVGELPRIQK